LRHLHRRTRFGAPDRDRRCGASALRHWRLRARRGGIPRRLRRATRQLSKARASRAPYRGAPAPATVWLMPERLPVLPLSGKLGGLCDCSEGGRDVLHPSGKPTQSRLLPLVLALAFVAPVGAADDPASEPAAAAAPICPVGVLVCPKRKMSYATCKRN